MLETVADVERVDHGAHPLAVGLATRDVEGQRDVLGGRQGGPSLDQNWRWITGERIAGDDPFWGGGEPNDNPFGTFIPGSEQHLEALDANAAVAGAWNDAPGFEEKFFIVESEHCN